MAELADGDHRSNIARLRLQRAFLRHSAAIDVGTLRGLQTISRSVLEQELMARNLRGPLGDC